MSNLRSRSICLSCLSLLLVVLLLSVSRTRGDDGGQQHGQTHNSQQEVQQQAHQQMNELIDSVKHAVHDADTVASDKSQVIDVGQSLTLLETKFSNLRAALVNELGVSKGKLEGHATSSKQLMDKSTDLVKSVVSQREQLSKLSSDVDSLDQAIRDLHNGLETFNSDIKYLNDIIQGMHMSNRELSQGNDGISHSVANIQNNQGQFIRVAGRAGKSRIFVIVIIVELVVFAAVVYFKKFASSSKPYSSSRSSGFSSKPYGKF